MRRSTWPLVLAIVLLMVGVTAGTARASPGVIIPPGGGGGCTSITYEVYIYNTEPAGSFAQVVIDGSAYSDGALVTLCVSTAHSISASIDNVVGPGFSFSYWYIIDGSVSSRAASSTTLTTGSAFQLDAMIEMVLSANNYYEWGGYIASGNSITSAWGSFVMPGGPYYQEGGCSATDVMGMWVGIGGVNGNLWQAGVEATLSPTSNCFVQLTFTPWYGSAPGNVHYLSLTVCGGEEVDIQLSVSGSYASATIDTCNGFDSYSSPQVQFTPDRTTVEWVAEAPSYEPPLPDFPSFSFYDTGYVDGHNTLGGFQAPVMYEVASDTALQYSFPYCINQFINPSWVSNGQFTDSYSQSNTYCGL